jgi:hypothetical protein
LTVRVAPQRSWTVIAPQVAPFAEQSCALLSGWQTHWFAWHVSLALQPPQLLELLHALKTLPHSTLLHDGAGHSQVLLEPQTRSLLHDPQEAVRIAPQLSGALTEPQVLPSLAQNCASVSGWQFGHVLLLSQLPMLHVPQLTVRITPQLSLSVTEPHWARLRPQNTSSVSAVQVHWLFAPQMSAPAHAPQLIVRSAPQLSMSVTSPHCALAAAQRSASVSGTQPHVLFEVHCSPAPWHCPQLMVT